VHASSTALLIFPPLQMSYELRLHPNSVRRLTPNVGERTRRAVATPVRLDWNA
jgi:hypothetical protein